MAFPLQMTFRRVEPTHFLDQYIRRQTARLMRKDFGLTNCEVTLDGPDDVLPRRVMQSPYIARIKAHTSHANAIVIAHGANEYIVLRDAFKAIRRRLADMQSNYLSAVSDLPAVSEAARWNALNRLPDKLPE